MQKLQDNLSSVFTDQTCLLLHLLYGDLAVFPDDENVTLSRNFFSIRTTETEFIKVARIRCIFPLCITVWQQSHPVFSLGSHGVTELHLFVWHWQCGFERKIPVLSGMLNCRVPESENILPAVNIRKTEQPWLQCQVVFWKSDSFGNKRILVYSQEGGQQQALGKTLEFWWSLKYCMVLCIGFWLLY